MWQGVLLGNFVHSLDHFSTSFHQHWKFANHCAGDELVHHVCYGEHQD